MRILPFLIIFIAVNNSLHANETSKINAFFDHFYQKNKNLCASVVVEEKDNIIFEKAYGHAQKENNQLNTIDTKFCIASITKRFVAALILKLAEEGKIDLHASIATYLDVPESYAKITPHHLLCHTSGTPKLSVLYPFVMQHKDKTFSNDELLKEIIKHAPSFEPGAQFLYSDPGYVMLGLIASKVTQKTLSQLMKDSFFTPLNMNATIIPEQGTIKTLQSEPFFKNLASGYVVDITNESLPYHQANYLDFSLMGASGGIISSAKDINKWNKALFDEKLLSHDMTNLMLTPHAQRSDDEQSCYGLMKQTYRGVDFFIHDGGFDGISSSSFSIPAFDMHVTILGNTSVDMNRFEKALNDFAKHNPSIDKNDLKNAFLENHPAIKDAFDHVKVSGLAHKLVRLIIDAKLS